MTPQVEQIRDRFVNLYLIVEEHQLSLVDAGTSAAPRQVERVLARRGRSMQDIKHILITHSDGDHIGGLAELRAATGAAVYAGAIEAEAIARGEASRSPAVPAIMQPLFQLVQRLMPVVASEATVIVHAGETLPILGGLQVLATPGHTPGHISYYAPEHGVLFAGDSMMASAKGLAFRDGPVTWNYALGRDSVRLQAALAPRMVCCGHGPVIHTAPIVFPT